MNAIAVGKLTGLFILAGFLAIGWLVLWIWASLALKALKRKVRISRAQDRTRTWLLTRPLPVPRAKGLAIPAAAGKLAREDVDWLDRIEEFLDSDEAWEHTTTVRPQEDRPEGSWAVVDESRGGVKRLMPLRSGWRPADELAFLQGEASNE